jgi:hypothetical protein
MIIHEYISYPSRQIPIFSSLPILALFRSPLVLGDELSRTIPTRAHQGSYPGNSATGRSLGSSCGGIFGSAAPFCRSNVLRPL